MRRAERGFTLIEIAVAVAILGVGVVTLQQIYQGSLRLQSRAARQSLAVLHARMAMDKLIAAPYVSVGGPECRDEAGFRTCTTTALAGPEDGGEPNPSDLELHDSDLQLYFLEVGVTWRDGAGDKTYTLKTLRTAAEPE
jgi:prepilin-type N-terminal cleavage/methylation domain-containing protein